MSATRERLITELDRLLMDRFGLVTDEANMGDVADEVLALLAEPTDQAPCRNCGHPLSHPWIAEHGRLFPQQSDPETPDVACIWRDCRHDVNGVRCACTDPAPTGELPF